MAPDRKTQKTKQRQGKKPKQKADASARRSQA